MFWSLYVQCCLKNVVLQMAKLCITFCLTVQLYTGLFPILLKEYCYVGYYYKLCIEKHLLQFFYSRKQYAKFKPPFVTLKYRSNTTNIFLIQWSEVDKYTTSQIVLHNFKSQLQSHTISLCKKNVIRILCNNDIMLFL